MTVNFTRLIGNALPDSFVPYVRAATTGVLADFELRRKPVGFIVAGAQKAGTSALASFVSQHPEIAFCKEKEPNYFTRHQTTSLDENQNFSKSQYHRRFPYPRGRIAGEASVGVMYETEAVQKCKEYNPNFKVILVLRNPVERAYSHYRMHVTKHNLELPFLECVQLGDQPPPETPNHRCHPLFFRYLDWSHYADRIIEIQALFDDVLILKHDDLHDRHPETLKTVFEFLGVDTSFKVKQKKVHSSPAYTMPVDVHSVLVERLTDEIEKLENLTGWDLSSWRSIGG